MLKSVNGDYDQLKVYNTIDMTKINQLVDDQYKVKLQLDKQKYDKSIGNDENMKMFSKYNKYNKNTKLEKYLLIFDDVLGDNKLSGFSSAISNYCTRSRHSNIVSIYTAQVYTKLPSVV